MAERKKVLYLGDHAILLGPAFVESPFLVEVKGADYHFYGQRLVDAIESTGELECTSLSAWDLYRLPPGKYQELLATHEVVIISDVEAKCFHLMPDFFDRKHHDEVLAFPDRIKETVRWVERGGGLTMLGGWLSFSGAQGRGGWPRTPLRDILPVRCLEFEDLVESSEGFPCECVDDTHLVTEGLPWNTFRPILGYNETVLKPEATPLVRVKGSGHPLLAVMECGEGRSGVFTCDPVPHWGINLIHWEGYDQFWVQFMHWLAG